MRNSPTSIIMDQGNELNIDQAYDIPYFWNLTEIQKIPLNISIEGTEDVWNEIYQKNFTVQYLYYTSQYWINNTPLRVYAALIIPDNSSGQLSSIPAAIVIHGLRGSHSSMMSLGYLAASYNYTILAIDLPGHGNSGGPPPDQEWIIPDLSSYNGTITPDLLNRTHFYLIARSAVRAVDVLLNQSFVDPTRIAMTGGSYGGLTTMFASNVYWQKVRSAVPVIASGDLTTSFNTPYSVTNLVVNPNQYDINQYPYSELIRYFDPLYYVNSTNNPATLFIAGTNDDFFPLETFNTTFYATNNDTKAISLSPGGHHGILMEPWEGTILYWLNYTMGNGPAPPAIQVSREVIGTFFGNKLRISVNVSSVTPISKVIFAYHREVTGAPWAEREMTQLNQSTWTYEIDNLPFNADITYFVMVELDGELYTMFSTSAWREPLTTWFEIPFFILIGLALALPIYLLVRRDMKRNKPSIPKENERKFLYLYGSQLGGTLAADIGIVVSLILPVVIILPQSNAMEISMTIILSEFIDFLPIAAPLIFTIIIVGCVLAISRPILGGLINMILPTMLLILGLMIMFQIGDAAAIAADFGISGDLFTIGYGLILWLLMGVAQVCFGIFKRKYQKRLQTKSSLQIEA